MELRKAFIVCINFVSLKSNELLNDAKLCFFDTKTAMLSNFLRKIKAICPNLSKSLHTMPQITCYNYYNKSINKPLTIAR